MKTISVSEAEKRLSNLVGALQDGPVLLLRNGRPCAALVGLDERFDREAFALGRNKRLRQLIDDACRRTEETGGISFSQMLAEIQKRPRRNKTRRSRPSAKGS